MTTPFPEKQSKRLVACKHKLIPFALLVCSLSVLAACGASNAARSVPAGSTGNRTATTMLLLSPDYQTLQSGRSMQFTATVAGTKNTAVTWAATYGSISSSGFYTAPNVTNQTIDTVSATSLFDRSKKALASVVIQKNSSGGGGQGNIAVSITPTSGTLQSGRSMQFTSQITGTSNTSVTWNAVLGSVSSSGLYTAPSVASQTIDTISAISAADPARYASVSITVTAPSSSGNPNVSEYWTSPSTGNDSNDGSQSHPWATITKADNALQLGADGTIVHLMPGTYGSADYRPVTTHNGTATQRIQFLCDTQYSCLFNNTFWRSQGNYVDIVGIELTAPNIGAGFYFGANVTDPTQARGNYSSLRNSHIHDIGTNCGANPDGGGIGIYNVTHDVTFDSNILDNTGVPGGCPLGNGGDGGTSNHWIYLQGYNATVTNNIISSAAGYGVESYHNNCNSVIANNTIIHNYVGGIQLAGADSQTDGNAPCPVGSRGIYTAINNNLLIRNGYGCGVHDPSANGGVPAGIVLESTGGANGAGTNTDQVFNNYSASNFSGTGDASCVNSPGTNNNVIVLYGGVDCYGGGCELPNGVTASSQGTNLTSTVTNNLVVNYQDSAWTGNFHLLPTSPAAGAGTNGNCASFPGISPCIPTLDFAGLPRIQSSKLDIGAY
jgi:hypothetical protein